MNEEPFDLDEMIAGMLEKEEDGDKIDAYRRMMEALKDLQKLDMELKKPLK